MMYNGAVFVVELVCICCIELAYIRSGRRPDWQSSHTIDPQRLRQTEDIALTKINHQYAIN